MLIVIRQQIMPELPYTSISYSFCFAIIWKISKIKYGKLPILGNRDEIQEIKNCVTLL